MWRVNGESRRVESSLFLQVNEAKHKPKFSKVRSTVEPNFDAKLESTASNRPFESCGVVFAHRSTNATPRHRVFHWSKSFGLVQPVAPRRQRRPFYGHFSTVEHDFDVKSCKSVQHVETIA